MVKPRLFESGRPARGPVSRCRDLVPREREECRVCGAPVERHAIEELALFRHGGYGAHRLTTFLVCRNDKCRTVRVSAVDEVNPRTIAGRV